METVRKSVMWKGRQEAEIQGGSKVKVLISRFQVSPEVWVLEWETGK